MANPYDTIHDLNAYCEGLERRLHTIKAQCAEWERVFGHLGDTPDECGNAIIAKRDELEERCAVLTDALRSTAQTLAWMQHGKCRGFSNDLLTTNEALDKARVALEETK